MSGEGIWREWAAETGRQERGSSLWVGGVFHGEVSYHAEIAGKAHWRPTLNGQALGGYPTMEAAKARVDWEIWNRVRLMKPGYVALLARRSEWENGNS